MRNNIRRAKSTQSRPASPTAPMHAPTIQISQPATTKDVAAPPPTEPEMLTYQGLSRVTGIRVGTLYGMVCRNEIPHYRLAARIIRFSTSEIASWMAGRHQPAREAGAE